MPCIDCLHGACLDMLYMCTCVSELSAQQGHGSHTCPILKGPADFGGEAEVAGPAQAKSCALPGRLVSEGPAMGAQGRFAPPGWQPVETRPLSGERAPPEPHGG